MSGWHSTTVNIPADAAPVSCSLFTLTPWSDGATVTTASTTADTGQYLSPVNAVTIIRGRLAGASGGLVVLLVTAASISDFTDRIGELAQVLPLPDVTRLQRQAASQQSNSASKMQIPPPYRAQAGAGALTFGTLRQAAAAAISSQAMQTPGAGGTEGLKQALEQFKQARQQIAGKISAAAENISAKSAKILAFCSDNIAAGREEILENIPHPQNAYTAAVIFSGDVTEVRRWLASQRSE